MRGCRWIYWRGGEEVLVLRIAADREFCGGFQEREIVSGQIGFVFRGLGVDVAFCHERGKIISERYMRGICTQQNV